MLCVTFIVRNWYDPLLCERHDATFDGAMFDSKEEIREWLSKNPNIEIVRIENLETGERISLD